VGVGSGVWVVTGSVDGAVASGEVAAVEPGWVVPAAGAGSASLAGGVAVDKGAGSADEVRRARAWLSRTVEPGNAVMHRFLTEHGPVEAAQLIRSGRAPEKVDGLAAARRGEDLTAADLAAANRLGIRLVTPEDDEWPAQALHPMEVATSRGAPNLAPPQALWVLGRRRLDEVVARAVAVVGSRSATDYGTRMATEIAYALAVRGWTVVSGGAYGIDGAAHRAALAASGVTIVVTAGGLQRPYPAGHARLFRDIAATGLLVSEWPPDCPPQRHRFLVRNRLIATLTAGTVVVEAGLRSGASSTARHARELGQAVMAVPGPVTSAVSAGAHHLIREEEACLVTCAEHVLEMVGAVGDDLAPIPQAPPAPRDHLTALARQVLDGMPAVAHTSPDRIAVCAGVSVADVLRCLPALEIRGFVEVSSAGWRLTAAARR
jgi:DNA processing protein